MITRVLTAVVLAALVGCGSYSPTGPTGAGGSSSGGYGGGSTGGGSTGGSSGGSTGGSTGGATGGNGGGAAPLSAAVAVGNDFFRSGHNAATPAVDTVAAGGTVTWTWTGTGSVPHSVESVGAPSFTSSDIKTGDGSTYRMTFATAGTYQYQCAVHGAAMRGTIVVR